MAPMMSKVLVALGGVVGVIVLVACSTIAFGDGPIEPAKDADVLSFTMTDIEGESVDLERYRGKVLVMVNTASRCGLTPQYKGLEALYREKKDDGLVVLGFPANDFMGQEPGSDLEIKRFCEANFDVTFPMFSKISVKGKDTHPLYAKLTGQPAPVGGPVKWNFQKYMVDRSGNVVAMFGPRTRPSDPEFRGAVDELLAQPGS